MRKSEVYTMKEQENQPLFEMVGVQWLQNAKLQIKESSYVKYANFLQNHIIPELGHIPVCELNTDVVGTFVKKQLTSGRRDGGGLAEKTVKDMLAVVKEICRYATCHGINIPCCFELIKVRCPINEVKVLKEQEQRQLEKILLSDESYTKTGILLSLYMGLRLGEVCALTRENISYKREIIRVRRTMQRIQDLDQINTKRTKVIVTEPKSISSIRDIPIPSFLMQRLQSMKYLPDNVYFLSGKSDKFVEPRNMENIFKRYLREGKIAEVNYHALRHTFATRCIESGFDAKTLSEILGHSNVNITLNRYVHSSLEQKRKNMNKLTLCV